MAEGEALAPAALIEPDERSTVSLWSRRCAKPIKWTKLVDIKEDDALEAKLADLEGEGRDEERQTYCRAGRCSCMVLY